MALGLGIQPDNTHLLRLRHQASARNAPKQMRNGVRSLFKGLETKLGGSS